MNWHFTETLHLHELPSTVAERWEKPLPMNLQGGNSHHDKSWKLMTSHTRRKAPAPPHDLKLQNGVVALTADEELGVPSNGASPVADPEPLGTTSDESAWLETSYCRGQGFPSADLVCHLGRFATFWVLEFGTL